LVDKVSKIGEKKHFVFAPNVLLIIYFVKHFQLNRPMNIDYSPDISKVWRTFEEICKIPRPSRSEEMIIDYIMDFAGRNGLEAHKDEVGNILIVKPAFPGMEDRKTTILQSHLDMVGEKTPFSGHDFTRDPIKPVRDGHWLRADDTTLGADDGIGIAAQLVILEDRKAMHGPLECLFTVDEETGMTGARNLRPGFMSGSILLNLDSEDEGELFIGCAGGIDTLGKFGFDREKADPAAQAYKLQVGGLKGGHSGDEIHIAHGNPIKILNRFLLEAAEKYDLRLSELNGGNMRNAIPREAFAIVTIHPRQTREFEHAFMDFSSAMDREMKRDEPGLRLDIQKVDLPEYMIDQAQQKKFLRAIRGCPHGVIRWSKTIKGLVETSTNLASVRFTPDGKATLVTSQRSSVEKAKTEVAAKIRTIFEEGGAEVEHSDGYPGWTPDPDSPILGVTRQAYIDLFGEEPVVRAIHAGLECGLILEKYPGLDMVSFGPTIKGAHTPSERIDVKSTDKFWRLLLEILHRIPVD
jgi:dipeptidase D